VDEARAAKDGSVEWRWIWILKEPNMSADCLYLQSHCMKVFSLLRLALYGPIGSAIEAFCLEQLRDDSEQIQLTTVRQYYCFYRDMLESEKTEVLGSF